MPSHLEYAYMSYLSYDYEIRKDELRSFSDAHFQYMYTPILGAAGARNRTDSEKDLRALFGNSLDYSRAALYLHHRNWEILSASCNAPVPLPSIMREGYLGVTFINHGTQEIVIAHRGTALFNFFDVFPPDSVFKKNILADIEILKGAPVPGEPIPPAPAIIAKAIAYIAYIVEMRDLSYPNYKISQTGHSLGGFLAEFGAAYMANPVENEIFSNDEKIARLRAKSFLERCNDSSAVTFDSLGSVVFLTRFNIPSNQNRTINYVCQPNIANTANRHDGIVLKLGEDLLLLQNSNVEASFSSTHATIVNFDEVQRTISTHMLINMIGYFDERTGNPRQAQLVTQWPAGVNRFDYNNASLLSVWGAVIAQCMEMARTNTLNPDVIHHFMWAITHNITNGVSRMTHQRNTYRFYQLPQPQPQVVERQDVQPGYRRLSRSDPF